MRMLNVRIERFLSEARRPRGARMHALRTAIEARDIDRALRLLRDEAVFSRPGLPAVSQQAAARRGPGWGGRG